MSEQRNNVGNSLALYRTLSLVLFPVSGNLVHNHRCQDVLNNHVYYHLTVYPNENSETAAQNSQNCLSGDILSDHNAWYAAFDAAGNTLVEANGGRGVQPTLFDRSGKELMRVGWRSATRQTPPYRQKESAWR